MVRSPSHDDDRTVAKHVSRIVAARRPAAARAHVAAFEGDMLAGNALPVGTALGEFEITGLVGEGGFGIVYLALDHSLQRQVAIKEYMPSALAARIGRTHVSIKSERHRETFETGLHSFVNEARMLAQFDHPSLLKVHRFWEDHGTAYMAMPYYEGPTLREHLRAAHAAPDEAWLRQLLEPLTEALAVLHAEHCYHRDIAPDNILLLKGSGRPLLLDFGAARRVIGDLTQALTVILKPGYAPLEQYAESPHMKQGPWTDVYALAAVVHYAILGRTPQPAIARAVADEHVPLAVAAAGRGYSDRLLHALDRALALRPQDRTPSMAALRADIGLDAACGARAAATADDDTTVLRVPAAPERWAVSQRPIAPPRRARAAMAPATPRRIALALAVVLLVAAVPAIALWIGQRTPAPASRDAAVNASGTTAALPAPAPIPAPQAPPPARPVSVLDEFDRIVQSQSPGFDVTAVPARRSLRLGRDRLAFTVSARRDGHVYVLLHDPDGSLTLLFPNDRSQSNRIRAGQRLALPQASWQLEAAEPLGTAQLLVWVSEAERDFSALARGKQHWFTTLRTDAPIADEARCAGERCDAWGAARFAVDVVR